MAKRSMASLLPQTRVYNRARRFVQVKQHLVGVHRAIYMDRISGFRIHRCLKSRFAEYIAALAQPPFLNSDRIREGRP